MADHMAAHAAPGPASMIKMRRVRHQNRHSDDRGARGAPDPFPDQDEPNTFVPSRYVGTHRYRPAGEGPANSR